MSAHRFLADGNRRNVQLAGPWLRSFTLLRVDGTEQGRTAAGEETLVLLLGGTFDLFARGSSWLQRGLRADAFGGRPCGLYLPPEVPYRFVGNGEILLVAGKRPPEKPQTPAAAKAARASMPLLPLAGSGKAYDARTGQWELLERFPSSPEGVLPRAIETLRVGDVKVERVFSFAFKALTLCLDECALAAGQRVVVPPPLTPPNTRYGDELALFVRCAGTAEVRSREVTTCTGDVVVPCAPGAPVEVTAGDASAYVVAVWAGDKNP